MLDFLKFKDKWMDKFPRWEIYQHRYVWYIFYIRIKIFIIKLEKITENLIRTGKKGSEF